MSIDLRRLVFLPAAILVAACSSGEETGETTPIAPGTRRIEITATDDALTPARIRARPNEVIHIRVRNLGTAPHTITFEFPHRRARLDRLAAPGQTADMVLVMPPEPGTYAFYSPVGTDQLHGLIGMLTVEPDGVTKPFHPVSEPGAEAADPEE